MSTSSSPIFTGSRFQRLLAKVISRAVSIASLPMNQLSNDVTTLGSEQTTLSSLSTTFSTLQSAVSSLNTAASSGNYSVSSSLTTVATATASNSAMPATYTLEVDYGGTPSTAASTTTVTHPTTQSISSAGNFTLSANGQQYTIVPPPDSNTLHSSVTAINSETQGAVQATVVNIGTFSQPSYELSLQSTMFSADDITLDDGSGNILGATSEGSPLQYRVNGQQQPEPADFRHPDAYPIAGSDCDGSWDRNHEHHREPKHFRHRRRAHQFGHRLQCRSPGRLRAARTERRISRGAECREPAFSGPPESHQLHGNSIY